eukprot:2311885-Heterocapsa_arctica.AAC.1
MLASRDLSAPWDADVIAVDASWWGVGAAQRTLYTYDVAGMGRRNERWCFSAERDGDLKARGSALAAALRG